MRKYKKGDIVLRISIDNPTVEWGIYKVTGLNPISYQVTLFVYRTFLFGGTVCISTVSLNSFFIDNSKSRYIHIGNVDSFYKQLKEIQYELTKNK